MKPLNGNRNKPINKGGFRGKKYAIHKIISESEFNELSTYEIYEKYNAKFKGRGVTINELSNILSRNKSKFMKTGMTDNGGIYTGDRSRKICLWSAVL